MEQVLNRNLNQYQVLEELGRGGFAAVYRALDTTSNRIVALKVLAPHLTWDEGFVARFEREAKTVASLQHPNIVAIHEVGQADGKHYIAMDYLEGRTLKQLIDQEGALTLERAAHIVQQLASALDYAHERGVVHRDIKPSNIIIGPDDHVTLTDFGIVKATEGTRLTSTGVTLGTPEYMSPEQGQGLDVDRRSDIYSLGVVLYEMLTGKVPFSGTTPLAVLHKHVYETASALNALNPCLPHWVEAVVGRALAKDPRLRFSTAGEMATAVLKGEQTAAMIPLPTVSKAAPSKRRPRVALWSLIPAAVVVILSVIGAAIITQGTAMLAQATATTTPLPIAPVSTVAATSTRTSTTTSTSTSTHTATPSATRTRRATSTPVPTPTVPMWTPALIDNFDDPHSGFSEYADETRSAHYQGGRYVMEVTKEDSMTWTTRGDFSDLRMEVDVTAGATQGNAGMVFRKQGDDEFYLFRFTPDGRYDLWKKLSEEQWTELWHWRYSANIRTGAATNRIRFVCVGSRISLYINDEYLDSVVDSTYAAGEIGLVAAVLAGESHALFYFDNLRVYQPPVVSAPTPSACGAEVACLELDNTLGEQVIFTIGGDAFTDDFYVGATSLKSVEVPPGHYGYTVSAVHAHGDLHGELDLLGGKTYGLTLSPTCIGDQCPYAPFFDWRMTVEYK